MSLTGTEPGGRQRFDTVGESMGEKTLSTPGLIHRSPSLFCSKLGVLTPALIPDLMALKFKFAAYQPRMSIRLAS